MFLMDLIGKALTKAKEHSPEILIGLGIGLGVASTIEACKATRKLDPILDEHNDNIEKIKDFYPDKEDSSYKTALTRQYVSTGTKLVKLYAPAAAMAGASIACILGSHSIQDKRIAGLSSAYAALDSAFRGYRDRVAKEVGVEKEKDIYFNRHDEEVIEVVKDENGNEKTVAYTRKVYDGDASDLVFTRVFQSGYTPFASDNDPFQNKVFLSGALDRLNSLGKERCRMHGIGVVTYNEILDYLGFKPVDYGYIFGVRFYTDKRDNPYGDNYISFGLEDNKANTEFINDMTSSVFLSFNIDRTPLYENLKNTSARNSKYIDTIEGAPI